jgi:2,4-dienoyl-CoA reductase-like NADH-dependent reductase (Old Yellow Enzyme family)
MSSAGAPSSIQSIHTAAKSSSSCSSLPEAPVRVPSVRGPSNYELATADVDESIDLFVKSAALSTRSGADGVQLHCAHGSFLF